MADGTSSGDLALDQLRASLQVSRYSAQSVLASLAVSLGGSVVALLIFLILRPRMRHLYTPNTEPNGRLADTDCATRSQTTGGWITELWNSDDADMLKTLGLDAVVLMRFLRLLRNMFVLLAVLGCGVGIPVNVIFNLRSQWSQNLSKSDAFIMMTPSLLSGNAMIPHIVLGWTFNAVVVAFLTFEFRKVLGLRRDVYMSPSHQRRLASRTLMALNLPKDMRSNRSLREFGEGVTDVGHPSTVSVGTSVKHLEKLLDGHSYAVRRLEYYSVRYSRAQAKHGADAVRPMIKPHISDARVDAIQYWTDQAAELEDRIAQERQEARLERKPLSYGFLSYPAQGTAHGIARDWRKRNYKGATLRLAPSPTDIIWSNINLTRFERANKQWWMNVIYTFLMILWLIPNAFIGCFLTNLSRLGGLWPSFGRAMDRSKVGFAILQGVLAPTITTLVFMILPWIMRKLSRWQGKPTRNEREKEVIRKLYAFFFIINFFVFTLMGVIWDVIVQALSLSTNSKGLSFADVWNTLRVPQRIATAVINISSFWVMYILRANVGMFLELLQVISLSVRTYQVACTTVTPRQRLEWTEAQPFPFAVQYLWLLFYMTLALSFTTIQPLVLLVAAFYFILAVPIKKYSLVYMFFTKYESNAAYWPLLHNFVLFAAGFGNLLLLCVVWVNAGWRYAVAVAPLPVTLIVYKVVSYQMFDRHFYFFDSDGEADGRFATESKADLEEVYENPALTSRTLRPILTLEAAAAEAKARASAGSGIAKAVSPSTTLGDSPFADSQATAKGTFELAPPPGWPRKGSDASLHEAPPQSPWDFEAAAQGPPHPEAWDRLGYGPGDPEGHGGYYESYGDQNYDDHHQGYPAYQGYPEGYAEDHAAAHGYPEAYVTQHPADQHTGYAPGYIQDYTYYGNGSEQAYPAAGHAYPSTTDSAPYAGSQTSLHRMDTGYHRPDNDREELIPRSRRA